MKYLFLIASLLALISVVDACVPEAETVALQQAPTIAYYADGDLRASCQCAPYFVGNEVVNAPQVRRQVWFPGKNIIKAIKARRARMAQVSNP
jgi:hypothetical protein